MARDLVLLLSLLETVLFCLNTKNTFDSSIAHPYSMAWSLKQNCPRGHEHLLWGTMPLHYVCLSRDTMHEPRKLFGGTLLKQN